MTEHQKQQYTSNERPSSAETLDSSAEHHEKATQSLEQAEKQHKSRQLERDALAKAAELAEKADKKRDNEGQAAKPMERHRGAPSKKQLKESFDSEMKHIRSEMNVSERILSSIIHSRPIEKTSEVVGTTIARPNAMLSGSIAAFVCITIVYFVARHYGYKLSGFETIAAFAIGWVIGILYDYLAELIRSRKS